MEHGHRLLAVLIGLLTIGLVISIYRSEKRIPEALALLGRAIKVLPRDSRSYVLRATIYTEQGRHSLAVADLKKHIELRPDTPPRSKMESYIRQHSR